MGLAAFLKGLVVLFVELIEVVCDFGLKLIDLL
jgi:hypothetical protein